MGVRNGLCSRSCVATKRKNFAGEGTCLHRRVLQMGLRGVPAPCCGNTLPNTKLGVYYPLFRLSERPGAAHDGCD